MVWRLAKSLDVLRKQVNEQWPKRDKSNDGTIGDTAHSSRSSDHNPNKSGVVTAIDITHDPNGPNAGKLADDLLASHDPRIKYLISNGRIGSGAKGPSPWKWRKYTGSNKHTKHVHLSVNADNADSTKAWKLNSQENVPTIPRTPGPIIPETTVQGDPAIYHIQRRLKGLNYNPGGLDGIWGGMTAGAIGGYINDRQLSVAAPTSFAGFEKIHSALRADMLKAETEKFARPIAPERSEVTPADLAIKLPEVGSSIKAERLGFWAAITTFVSASVTGVSKFIGDAIDILNPVKEFIGDLPWGVWVAGAIVISGALYYISRQSGDAKDAATLAYQEGARV